VLHGVNASNVLHEISGSHDEYKDGCLLGCSAVQYDRNWTTFQRCLLSPSQPWGWRQSSSEMSVNFYHTTRRYIPEDSSLQRIKYSGNAFSKLQLICIQNNTAFERGKQQKSRFIKCCMKNRHQFLFVSWWKYLADYATYNDEIRKIPVGFKFGEWNLQRSTHRGIKRNLTVPPDRQTDRQTERPPHTMLTR
jgi:hypothetical protein